MDYQINMMEQENPFDILLFSPETEDRPLLEEKQKLLEDFGEIEDVYVYSIYTDGDTDMNDFFYDNLPFFQREGYEDLTAEGENPSYFSCDTYMKLSDYNSLRKAAGYRTVSLEEGTYLIHAKTRVRETAQKALKETLVLPNGEG